MTVRIGNCSGYYGDRPTAFREMLEGGELDYLTGDYLAELTMLILGKDRMKDPEAGYAKTFLRQLQDGLALAREKGVKVVANAGGLNPAGLAARIRELAQEQGIDVQVAHVEGDDLLPRAAELGLSDVGGGSLLTANAYLGAFGIAAALDAGADVVVTGRVTDASRRPPAATSAASALSTPGVRSASPSRRSTPTAAASSPSTRAPARRRPAEPSPSTPSPHSCSTRCRVRPTSTPTSSRTSTPSP